MLSLSFTQTFLKKKLKKYDFIKISITSFCLFVSKQNIVFISFSVEHMLVFGNHFSHVTQRIPWYYQTVCFGTF